MVEIIKALSAKLPLKDTSTRTQSGKDLTYIPIESTINWLNQHVGMDWGFTIGTTTFERHPDDTDKGKPQWMATCVVDMYVFEQATEIKSIRSGWGAAVNFDPDTAVKTAQAEAVKKASNQFGVALYLWDEDERNVIHAAWNDDAVGMQNYLVQKAVNNGVDETKESVAAYYNVEPSDLADVETLKRLVISH